MKVGTLFGVMIAIALVGYGLFWLLMLSEILKRPESAYRNAGESRAVWFVVVLVLQFFGTLAYVFMARNKLKRADDQTSLAPNPGQ